MKYIKLLCVFCMMFLPVMVFAQGQIKRSSTTRTPPPSSNTVRRSSSTSAAKEKSVNKKQSVEQKVFPVRNKVEVSHSEVRDTLVVFKVVPSLKTEVLQAPVSSDKSGTIDGHDYVDLGLPSGTLWATCNVGASKPEGYGNYYAWGETATKTVYDWSTYKWTSGSSSTPTKYTGSSSAELEQADDAAYVNWGKNWRMPSQAQFEELINSSYTTTTWTSINGIYGRKITSKMPGYTGNSIFLPAAGCYRESSLDDAGSDGDYWSRTLSVSNTSFALSLNFNSSNVNTRNLGRCYGRSLRPVRNKVEVSHSEVTDSLVVTEEVTDSLVVTEVVPSLKKKVLQAHVSSVKSGTIDGHDYVDLGLPSGTLWATCNVGAFEPEGYGNYYAWGETVTKTVYDWSTYKWTSGSSSSPTRYTGSFSAVLELADDAAYVNWGKNWRMPSEAQFEELINNDYTTTTWTRINGIYGRKITSKMPGYTGNSIFLPAAGYYYNGSSLYVAGSDGLYWSRTLDVSYTSYAMGLSFNASNIDTNSDYRRFCGRSIRPVRFSE